jgi:hypothetical protein
MKEKKERGKKKNKKEGKVPRWVAQEGKRDPEQGCLLSR